MILPDFRENRACGVRFLAEKHIFLGKNGFLVKNMLTAI